MTWCCPILTKHEAISRHGGDVVRCADLLQRKVRSVWLYVPSTCFPCAAELADSILPSGSLYPMLAQYAMSRGKRIASKSWQGECKRKPWMNARFGQTLKHSTASLGVARFIASLPESPAKEIPLQEKDGSKKTRETSGQTRAESFGKWDRNASFWRTCQAFLFQSEGNNCPRLSQGYSESWPKTGSMRSGLVYQREKWDHPRNESDCSSWPTASARDHHAQGSTHDEAKHSTQLALTAAQWPTPNATASNDGESPETWQARADQLKEKHTNGNGAGMPLAIAAQLWATPRASENENRQTKPTPSQLAGEHGMNLATQAVGSWPTPTKNANSDCPAERRRKTPAAAAAAVMMESLTGHLDPPAATNGSESLPSGPTSRRRRLNPRFVEWLQGLPPGWVSLEPLALTSFERWGTLSCQLAARSLS
jgi:hypothetical protein